MAFKKKVAVDFDGVIHAYRRGWEDGTIYDDPVTGTKEALATLAGKYEVVVYTARDQLLPIKVWLNTHGLLEYISEVTNQKPKAVYYIDDRAIRFVNWSQALHYVDLHKEEAATLGK